MTSIKLYGDVMSQVTRSVMAVLAIGKIPYTFVPIDLNSFQQKSAQFRKINPFMKIPYLTDGEVGVSESNAILYYLCEKYQSIPKYLSGQNIQQRAIVNQYMSWYQNQFRPNFFEIIYLKKRFLFLGEKGMFSQDNLQLAVQKMNGTARLLDKLLRLKGGPFLTGNRICLADILIYFEYTNIQLYGISYPNLKNIQKWHDQMQTIPEIEQIMKKVRQQTPLIKQMFELVQPKPKL